LRNLRPIPQPFETIDKKPIPRELRVWQDVEQIQNALLNDSDDFENETKNVFTVIHTYEVYDKSRAIKYKVSKNTFECYSGRQMRSYLRDLIALPYGAKNCEVKIVIKKKNLD
jgi:hypothetical protein